MDSNHATRHTIEIPLASDGSAKLTLRGNTVEELIGHLSVAETSIEQIVSSARKIIVACCVAAPEGGRS